MDSGVAIYSVSPPHGKKKPHTVSEVNQKCGNEEKRKEKQAPWSLEAEGTQSPGPGLLCAWASTCRLEEVSGIYSQGGRGGITPSREMGHTYSPTAAASLLSRTHLGRHSGM